MSCVSVMMRMRNRARNGAVGESRLETGAHHAKAYPNFAWSVNTHARCAKRCLGGVVRGCIARDRVALVQDLFGRDWKLTRQPAQPLVLSRVKDVSAAMTPATRLAPLFPG